MVGSGWIVFNAASPSNRNFLDNAATAIKLNWKVASGADTLNTLSGQKIGSIDLTGFSGTFTGTQNLTQYGDFKIGSTLTFTSNSVIKMTGNLGTTQVISSNGASFVAALQHTGASTLMLGSNITVDPAKTTTLSSIFTTVNGGNNYNFSTGILSLDNSSRVTFGSSTIALTGTGTVFTKAVGSYLDAGTSTI